MWKSVTAIFSLWVVTVFGQSVWTLQSPFPTNKTMVSILYGGSQFVRVGRDGNILTSPDGITWTLRNSGLVYLLNSVTYGGSQYVAVGQAGTILTSPDGFGWTARQSKTQYLLNAVTFGNSQFVAVSQGLSLTASEVSTTIHTSPNGINWTQLNSGTGSPLYSAAFGGSLFVVVGYGGAILTSDDGVTWTIRNSGTTSNLHSVTYGDSKFVVVGQGGTILTSPDGINWTVESSGTTTQLMAITYGASQFVATGYIRTVLTSPDGKTWTTRNVGTTVGDDRILASVAFGNGKFMAVDGGNFLTSPQDGLAVRTKSSTRGISLRWTASHLFASYPKFLNQTVHAVLLTANGNKVIENWVQGDRISLPVSSLARGVYTLQIASGKERVNSRFVKY
jgi:hypothetical protein